MSFSPWLAQLDARLLQGAAQWQVDPQLPGTRGPGRVTLCDSSLRPGGYTQNRASESSFSSLFKYKVYL